MGKRSDEKLLLLPESKSLDDKQARNELNALLAEAHSLREMEKRLKEVKARIAEIVQEQSLVGEDGAIGVRNGILCVVVRWCAGRAMLSREALVEAGVTPDQIKAGTKQGADYQVVELAEMEQ